MSETPILLFLHGVGKGDPDDEWMSQLELTLASLGYPSLDNVRAIAPKYSHALKGTDDKLSLPPLSTKAPTREAAKANRRNFESRMAGLEYLLGRHSAGQGWFGADVVINVATITPFFKQVENYLKNDQIRAQVLHRILRELPDSGRIVIVAHSLGSVIGADLLRRLPPGLNIAGMVTIGSLLAHGHFDVDKLKATLKEPPTDLAWWVNFWNSGDPVAAHRGLSSVFPWMLDFRVNGRLGLHIHDAITYLVDPVVSEAIGYGLFGSKSREIVRVSNAIDTPVNTAEQLALLALRFSYLIEMRLENEVKTKYMGARRYVQAMTVAELTARNTQENESGTSVRPLPAAVQHLAFDLSDPGAPTPEPLLFPALTFFLCKSVRRRRSFHRTRKLRMSSGPFEIPRAANKARPGSNEGSCCRSRSWQQVWRRRTLGTRGSTVRAIEWKRRKLGQTGSSWSWSCGPRCSNRWTCTRRRKWPRGSCCSHQRVGWIRTGRHDRVGIAFKATAGTLMEWW